MTLTKGTRRFIKTVRHMTRTNTPVFRSAPDNTSFGAYCVECEDQSGSKDIEVTVMNSEVKSDNNNASLQLVPARGTNMDITDQEGDNQPNMSNISNMIRDGNDTLTASTDEGELLRWHYRLGHLAWRKLKLLALLGIIPRRLALLRSPPCPCCIAASMARLPTRTKGKSAIRNIHPATRSGQYVSVDQMECSTPGFVAQ